MAFGVCQWGMLFCGWQNSISHWQSGNFLKPKNFLAFWVPKAYSQESHGAKVHKGVHYFF